MNELEKVDTMSVELHEMYSMGALSLNECLTHCTLDAEGEAVPCTFAVYQDWMCKQRPDVEHGRVALEDVGIFRVSTVCLFTDLTYGRSVPLFFETMVFNASITDGGNDEACRRYSTRTQALEGHAFYVRLYGESARKALKRFWALMGGLFSFGAVVSLALAKGCT
jgi:hypothetical protein